MNLNLWYSHAVNKIAIIFSLTLILNFSILYSPPIHAAIPPELGQAMNHVYNANFTEAAGIINSYIANHPKDPSGYLLRGMMKEWDQVVNNKMKTLNPAILADYEKANTLAEEESLSDPENVDKMIMLGNTLMYVAKKLVDDGHKIKAGSTIKRAKNYMLDAIAKEPENYNAYMAVGVFNYFTDNIPAGFKWLAALLGFKGSRTVGIDYLLKAADNTNLTQADAAYMLVYIYDQKEKNHALALKYNNLLKTRYPENPAFQYETGELLFRQKKYADSRTAYDDFLTFCTAKPKGFCSNKYLFLAHYFYAWSFMEEKNYTEAKKHLGEAIKLNTKQYKDRNVDLDLWAGILEIQNGNKEAALSFFKKVEEKQSDNPGAWERAKKEMQGL